jgi:uncharacterized double-CXXCG motif protein
MIRLFKVIPDDNKWGNLYDVIGSHTWGLPGVMCPTCKEAWTTVGLSYPSIDLSAIQNEKRYRIQNIWPVPLNEFKTLSQPLTHLMPDKTPPRPGTDFGPLCGEAKGEFGDFAWPNTWTLLVKSESLNLLRSGDLGLPVSATARLAFKKGESPDLLELQIEPYAKLAYTSSSGKITCCHTCGRYDFSGLKKMIVDEKSVPKHVDIFRGIEATTTIFCTSQFMDSVKSKNLTNIVFQPVETE